jgi:tetratricopeptide (TPR) repeat protein
MKHLLLLVLLGFVPVARAQAPMVAATDPEMERAVSEAYAAFRAGRYGATRRQLDVLAVRLEAKGDGARALRGLVAYWRGVTANRQNEFTEATKFFEEAIRLDYRPKDIYYEYGQTLYAQEKLAPARQAFAESLRRGHKRAVCLYYLGFISQTLGDNKMAVTFYRAVEKLPPEEGSEVLQAARMQVADIYLAQSERRPDAHKVVEGYVLPQYREALAVAPESALAADLRAKITELQQRYELILYRMRNGRPTPVPPYYLRLLQDFTYDTNPVFAATETTNSEAKQGSPISRTEAFGRHTFFYKNIMSISPEVRASYTRHLQDAAEIRRNDNWVLAPAVRTAFEHMIGKRAAAVIADLDHAYTQRARNAELDYNADSELKFNSRITTATVGERVTGLWGAGDTTLRLRHRKFESYLDASDSAAWGLGVEHVLPRAGGQLWIFTIAHDRTRVTDEAFDTNTTFARADVIFPAGKWGLIPQLGFGLTLTDPLNDPDRGQERTYNPSARVSKPFGLRWRAGLHADFMENVSKDKANFAYRKTFYGVDLEYVF